MKPTVQNYLKTSIAESSKYTLNRDEEKQIQDSGLETFIYTKLTSKKFRKFKMTESSIEHTKTALHLQINNNNPLTIVYPQGGYKLWRLPSTPHVDWAEFFVVSYVLTYIAPIAAAYKPGVQIVFYLHTLLMEFHGNLDAIEIKRYGISFEKLLEAFKKHLPANITMRIIRDADLYSREEYKEELEQKRFLVEKEYPNWTNDHKEKLATMARMNIKWNGAQDWTKLSSMQKEEKIYIASLYEKAATMLERVGEKIKSPENIVLFNTAVGIFIGIGTTKSSIAKYWVGYGVLVKKGDSYQSIILTPKQYETVKDQSCEHISLNIVDDSNFSSIMVFDKPFLFHTMKN